MVASLLFGFDYDEVLLKTQATIFPKIMLLDKKLDQKLVDGKIIYGIIYTDEDYQTALEIKEFIDAKYNGTFGAYPYKVNFIRCTNLSKATAATAIYVLNSCRDIVELADIAREKGIISFAYDVNNLQEGLLFSLNIERSTIFYLNKKELYTKKVDFVDPVLQMVRFVDKEKG